VSSDDDLRFGNLKPGQRQLVHATENMMLEFITAISCPVLVIEAERHSEFRELTKG
jgi:hypothetical protein